MSIANTIMQLRRTVHEADMGDEHMPDVVLLFRDHRAKDIFESAVRNEFLQHNMAEITGAGNIRVAGISLVIGVR